MKRLCLLDLLLATLPGCMVGPDYQRPEFLAPPKWSETSPREAKMPTEWWKTFNDACLNRLIAEAITANLDLKQATARIRDARAQRGVTLAAGLPSLDATSSLSRRRNNFAGQGGSGGAPFGGSGFGGGQQIIDIFQMGFDANWELDIFGGARRALEATEATLEAEEENRRAVQVSLLAEVARLYIDLRAHQRLITVTQRHVAAQQDTLELTRVRQQAGLTTALEVTQQQTQVAATQARLPTYETALKLTIHALAVLLGKDPGALAGRFDAGDTVIPLSKSEVAPDLPSELLRRRPDIRRAERQLAAATARIGVATAELYPRVNLAAFLGLQNTRITDFTPIGKSWSMASSLSMPIFNWGRLRANIDSKEALQEQAMLSYQSTVLGAFREVEDALVAHAQERERRTALAQATEASRLALELAQERYLRGLTAFLDVLEAQRAVFEAEANLIGSEAEISARLVALYKALGGGWEGENMTTPILGDHG